MSCFKCNEVFSSTSKQLKCYECNSSFHVECVEGITDRDFQFIVTSSVLWKCNVCQTSKKHDERPITPARESKMEFSSVDSSKNCKICNKGFSYNAHRAICNNCRNVFHFKCVAMTKDEYNQKYGKNQAWSCHDCSRSPDLGQRERTRGRAGSDQLTDKGQVTSDVTNADILKAMTSLRTDVMNQTRELTDSMNKHSDWVAEISSKIDDVSNKMTSLVEDMSLLRQENVNLKKQVSELVDKVNILEQTGKENTVEIQGVPCEKNENILDLLSKISKAIGFEFNENMIDNCFRLKSTSPNWPGVIVARFVRKLDMEKLFDLRRKKRNLNSRDIGFMDGNANVIYFNSSLTQAKRKLLKSAKEKKKEKQFTFLWVRNGRIFMRKTKDDQAIEVKSEEDLQKLY